MKTTVLIVLALLMVTFDVVAITDLLTAPQTVQTLTVSRIEINSNKNFKDNRYKVYFKASDGVENNLTFSNSLVGGWKVGMKATCIVRITRVLRDRRVYDIEPLSTLLAY